LSCRRRVAAEACHLFDAEGQALERRVACGKSILYRIGGLPLWQAKEAIGAGGADYDASCARDYSA
jgi:hypothetical protein